MRSSLRIASLLTVALGSSPAFAQPSSAVTLTSNDTDPTGAVDQLARFVGQRVRIPLLKVVAPTDGQQVFYGVISGIGRPFRGAGLAPTVALPDGVCCATHFAGNPELLRVDSSAVGGLTVAAGTVLSEVAGMLDSQNGAYVIALDTAPGVGDTPAVTTLRAPGALEFTVSSLQPTGSADTDLAIAHDRLHDPDILTVASGASALADALNTTLGSTGYQAFGDQLLIQTARLTVVSVDTVGSFTVARLSALQPATDGSTFTLIAARFPQTDSQTSLDVQQARRTEAEALAKLVDDRQSRGERVIVAGDFESYQFSDGFVDVVGTVRGVPTAAGQVLFDSPALVQTPLVNLLDLLPPSEQYSATAAGDAVALDHILASSSLNGAITGFGYARGNADFPLSGLQTQRDQPLGFVSGASVSNLTDATSQVAPSATVVLSPGATTLTISIANFSRATARGPFHLMFQGQIGSFTITNSNATLLGNQLLSLAGSKLTLTPGETASVTIQCVNPTAVPLTVSVKVLSGTLP